VKFGAVIGRGFDKFDVVDRELPADVNVLRGGLAFDGRAGGAGAGRVKLQLEAEGDEVGLGDAGLLIGASSGCGPA